MSEKIETAKELTTLEKIRAEWVKNGKNPPAKKLAEELSKSLKSAKAIKIKAQEELAKTEEHLSKVYMELAKAYGCQSLRIDGIVYDFSSRGEKVFLKSKATDVVDL